MNQEFGLEAIELLIDSYKQLHSNFIKSSKIYSTKLPQTAWFKTIGGKIIATENTIILNHIVTVFSQYLGFAHFYCEYRD